MQPHITLIVPPDNLAFWGAILGAFIGTLGALFTALIAVWADRRKTKSEYLKKLLRNYNRHLFFTETALDELIPILIKNINLLQECVRAEGVGNFMMTLPRSIELFSKDAGDYINRQLVNEWVTLSLRTKMCNQLIEDFTYAYKEMRQLAFNTSATGLKVNVPLLQEHKQQLLEFAASTKDSTESLKLSCLRMLAMLQLHGELLKSEETKFKDVKTLEHYELDSESISKRVDELKESFDPKKVLAVK